ncbi:MAG: V-type ATPase subunit [Candidatus Woesearchaeota archaeon]
MTQQAISMGKIKSSLSLGTYPYTYARTCFMRAALLKKADYEKLMKMTPNEITEFLQENAYRKEINGLEGKYSGAELVEVALNRNLEEAFSKMRRISNKKNILKVIDAYLMRYDVRNIKNVLRAKYTHSEAASDDLIIACGSYSREFFMKLLKKESIEGILKENGLVAFDSFEGSLKTFKETNILGEIESVFEKKYFAHLFDLAARIPKQGKFFRAFLESEIEITNILNVLRLKRAGVDERSASRYLLPVKMHFGALLGQLMTSDISKAPEIFSKTPYAKIMEESTKKFLDSGSLIDFETGLWNFLLNRTKTLIHQHPLSVDVIMGYIFAKDIETRNLKLLMKGKQFGFDDAFIESQLVM